MTGESVMGIGGRGTIIRGSFSLIKVSLVSQDRCGPQAGFGRRRLRRLSEDVGRGKIVRPVIIHPGDGYSKHCRIIYKRTEIVPDTLSQCVGLW